MRSESAEHASLDTLAREAFPDLRESERRAAAAVESGREERFGDAPPVDAPESDAIRSEVLRWLLVHAGTGGTTASGMRLRGARIAGDLVLDGLKLDFPVLLTACALERLSLIDAGLVTLHLDGSRCTGIQGGRVTIDGGLLLGDGFRCDGAVRLPDATIHGDLNCDGGRFCNTGRQALLLDGARVGGRIFLRGGEFSGAVHAINARVEGGVSAGGAVFEHPDELAIDFERIRANGFLSLARSHVRGRVRLSGATVASDLNLSRLRVERAGGDAAIEMDRCTVAGRAVLTGACPAGTVLLRNASVGKTLECSGAKLGGAGAQALTAAGSSIGGRVVLRDGFEADGRMTFTGATILGDVSMDGSSCIVAGEEAGLQLNRALTRGNVELAGRIAGRPALNLTGTEVRGDVDLRGGRFETGDTAPEGYKRPVAIRGEGLSVAGSLLAERMVATTGEVRLPRSVIGGDANFTSATVGRLVLGATRVQARLLLEDTKLAGFSLVSGDVGGRFRWKPKDLADDAGVELRHATVGYLDDRDATWPKRNLDLDGFTYGGLYLIGTIEDRLRWIRAQTAQTKRSYSPRPYEQLIAVLRRDGHEGEAREVAMAKQRDLRKHGGLGPPAKAWNLTVGVLLGHGYQVWRALVPALVLVVIGAFAFDAADMKPAKSGQAPGFHAVAYSVDALLPVINLHQEEYRLPSDGRWEEAYLWVHIALGWALTTLFAVGLTGLVRKD